MLLGSITHLNDLDLRMQEDFPGLAHEAEDLFTDTSKHLMKDWVILVLMAAVFSIASLMIIKAVSKDER